MTSREIILFSIELASVSSLVTALSDVPTSNYFQKSQPQYGGTSYPLGYKTGLILMESINRSTKAPWSTLNHSDLTNKNGSKRKNISSVF